MRWQSKLVEIPSTATKTQMESSLDTHLNTGWDLITIFDLGSKTWAVLVRNIVK